VLETALIRAALAKDAKAHEMSMMEPTRRVEIIISALWSM
jgi:hypothetical protein